MNSIISIVKNVKAKGNRIIPLSPHQLYSDILSQSSSPEWYEEIFEKCKPYFDIDFPPKNIKLSYQEYLEKEKYFDTLVLQDFVEECKNIFNVKDDFILITKGEVKERDHIYKCSYHIVIKGIITTKNDMKKLVKEINKKYFLDSAPYSNNGKQQIFRLPLCSKNNERKLLLLNGDFLDHLITYFKGDEKIYTFSKSSQEMPKPIQPIHLIKEKPVSILNPLIQYDLLHQTVIGLSPNRSIKYDDWLPIIFSILRISYENNYIKKGELLCHLFSQLSNTYDEYRVNEIIQNIHYRENGYKLKFLKDLLYHDNRKLYNTLFDDIEDYENMKIDFEIMNFKIMNPIVYINLYNNDPFFSSPEKFCQKYRNMWCKTYDIKTLEIKRKQFIYRWMDDKHIRTYQKMDFLPHPLYCPPDVFNLYDGLIVEKLPLLKEDDNIEYICKDILEHIFILTGKDSLMYKYFIAWLAQIVQQPGILSRTAPVIKSEQGVGKNIFLDFFGHKILGEKYFYSSSRAEDFFGRFNTALKNKLLLNLNETNGKDTFVVNEKIKTQITDVFIPIEQKGIDTITLRNCGRYVFTTNNDNAVKIQPRERRLFCMESSSVHKSDYLYFKNLKSKMDDEKVIRAFYEVLMKINLTNYDFENQRPKTELYKSMSNSNIPIIAIYLEEYVNEMCMDEEIHFVNEIFENYNRWKDKIGYKEELNIRTFGTKLTNIYKIKKPSGKSSKGTRYILNKNEILMTLKSLGYQENQDENNNTKTENRPKLL